MDVKEPIDLAQTKRRDADKVGKHEADGCSKRWLDSIAHAQSSRAIRAARREGPHAPSAPVLSWSTRGPRLSYFP